MPIIGRYPLIQRAIFSAVIALSLGSLLAAAQTPSNSVSFETLSANATSSREAGRTDEAIRNYRSAVELHPAWDEGWWYLGTLLYDSDHFEEAIPALHHLVGLDPQLGPAWAFLGLCEFETGDYPNALAHLQTAHRLGFAEDPEIEKVALYHLGLLLNLHGEFEQSTDLLVSSFGPSQFTEQIKVALGFSLLRVPLLPTQIDPSKDALIHAAGETAVSLANHETDAASRDFEAMLRDYPGTPYLHYQYGLALASASQFQSAEAQLREESRLTPKSPLPQIALASLNEQRNASNEALAAAREAVQIAPNSAAAQQALARALKVQNKEEEAAIVLRRADELATQPAEVDATQASRYALNRGAAIMKAGASDSTAEGSHRSATSDKFEEETRHADSARRVGRLDEAAASYRNALKLRSNWQEGWRQLGTVEYMQSHYPEAVAALQQSVALESKQADTWTLLGLSEFETKDYKNSQLHLERGRALGFSGNAAAVRVSRYHLALLLNLSGDFDSALDLLIPETGPGPLADEIQFAMGLSLLRIASLPEQVEQSQRELVRQAGGVATLLAESRYDKAFPIFENLLTQHPMTPYLHYAYGDALAGTSMYDEAQIQLRQEIKLNPASALPYLRLASIALMLHQTANALVDSKQAVVLAPASSEAHYLLGRSHLEGGSIPEAIRELETARRLAPNSPKIHLNLARAYLRADRSTEAQQERAEFERLNAQLPGGKNSYGDRTARGVAPELSDQPMSH